jgi:hypothetical protein
MSGPIVRTGTNPKFWANYDRVFGKKPKGTAVDAPEKKKAETASAKAAKKPAKKAKKSAKKK